MNQTGKRARLPRGVPRLLAAVVPGCSALAVLWTVAVVAEQPQSVEIAVIGDYGAAYYSTNAADSGEARVARMIKGWDPDFIMTVGDNNYGAGQAETIDANIGQFYHEYISPYQGIYGEGAVSNRFFPCLGNHDMGTSNGAPYLDYFTLPGNERYYSYRYGPVEIFALNSEFPEPDGNTNGSVQAQWLQSQLAASTARWKLVYFHAPPYGSGAQYGPTPAPYMHWPFAEWGTSAVLTGHEHIYERLLTNGLTYFINGLGGAGRYPLATQPIAGSQARFNQDYGAMRIVATDTNIAFEFVTRSNVVIDSHWIPPAPPGLPIFTRYPGSRTVRPGTNVTFNVEAGGDAPLSYQWQFNGVPIPDATNFFLNVTNILPEHAGAYAVLVSNRVGELLSSSARLTVLTEPTIFHHPRSTTVPAGTNVTLGVIAEGRGPLAYQWRQNGTNLPGATNVLLTLTNVQLAQNGEYRVLVSDDLASTLSASANLIVLVRPLLVQHPVSQNAVEGGTVVFSASVTPGTMPMTYRWVVGSRTLTNVTVNQLTNFFVLTNAQLTNAGVYRVAVTNLAGVSTPSFSGPAILTVLADGDHDGLPNQWEDAYQLNSGDSSDALIDSDGDSMTNWQEYIAGTNPRDPVSCLKIEIIRVTPESPPLTKLSFMALSNRTYAIERRDLAASGVWSRLADIVATSANRMVEITNVIDSPEPARSVYRIVTPRLP